ncbi:hypothetical protein C4D60_Mb08t01940 [Musa balbisiana]|uniref:Uncharacterized protein n=1 Tax=Musa balbisiana TaxID=52838 RepID=A0A4S8K0L2_MUSBA|nr:hypothetical protein C4D60_Mb08t01940 [Musa balbisiana]
MSAGAPPSVLHFPMDDPDLDDAELWAVIDTAAASRSRNPLLPLKNPNPHAFSPSPMGSKPFRNPRHLRVAGEMTRVPADGEVVQEAHWDHRRPHKMAKFVESGTVVDERRMVVVRHPQRPPVVAVSSPSYWSPDQARFMAKSRSPVVESPPPEGWKSEEKETMSHSLGGRFPSVSSFKHYQNTAMAILEKSDYTMIHGNPFIKKSGWRKISFFFNLSFEIRDKSIEFDENRNVQRAEFVVRAYMQYALSQETNYFTGLYFVRFINPVLSLDVFSPVLDSRCGRFADGWGSCDRREKKFLKPNHDIPSTAETRAKNKACQDLLGIGEYRPGAVNGLH